MRISYIQVQRFRKSAAALTQVPTDSPAEPQIALPPVITDDDRRLYKAIVHAETGAFKDPWIRTMRPPVGGSSSAYGEAQITYLKARDYFNRFPEDMAASREFYEDTMRPMYEMFLKYGNEPNNRGYEPRWNHGGYGKRLTDEEKGMYRLMGLSMMRIDANRAAKLLPKGTPDEILRKRIELWRGVPYDQDPEYYDKVIAHYNNNANVMRSTAY